MSGAYRIVHSFHIDDGQLDGLAPQQCFTLGVEWQTVYGNILKGIAFEGPVRHENRERITKLLEAEVRKFEIKEGPDESWLWLEVEGVGV